MQLNENNVATFSTRARDLSVFERLSKNIENQKRHVCRKMPSKRLQSLFFCGYSLHDYFHRNDPGPLSSLISYFEIEVPLHGLRRLKLSIVSPKPSNNCMTAVHLIYFYKSRPLLSLPLINHINQHAKLMRSLLKSVKTLFFRANSSDISKYITESDFNI